MAHEIISKFWSEKEADKAQKTFESVFQERDYSKAETVHVPDSLPNPIWIVDLMRQVGGVQTSSEAKRLIESKAVEVDGEVVIDFKAQVQWKKGTTLKVGKHRIVKIA